MPAERTVEGDLYTIQYDPEVDAVVFRWHEYVHGEQFREGAEHLLSFFESVETSRMIVDSTPFAELSPADKSWLQSVSIPGHAEAGAERVALVHSGSVLQQLDHQELDEEAADQSGETFLTDSLAEARAWIQAD